MSSPIPGVTRILILHQRRLGDIVLATPAVRLIAAAYPQARITFLCQSAFTCLVEDLPELAEVRALPKLDGNILSNWWALRCFGRRLRAEKYDLAVDLRCSRITARLTAASAAPVRVGRNYKSHGYAYTHFVEPAEFPGDQHLRDYILRSAFVAGCEECDTDIEPRLHVPANATDASRRLGLSAPFAILQPGSSRAYKCWPAENFAKLADFLSETYGLSVAVHAGPGEQDRADEIIGYSRTKPTVVNSPSLPDLTGILNDAKIVVGSDSGPMHMAGAVGTPVVSLYMVEDPVCWAVLGAPGRMLKAADGEISMEQVTAAVSELLDHSAEEAR